MSLAARDLNVDMEHDLNLDLKAKLEALDRVQAVIEFDLHGNILTANENFLRPWGIRCRRFAESTIAYSAIRITQNRPSMPPSGTGSPGANLIRASTANENFLKTLGYTLDEVKGRHHRIFCDSEYASSRAYVDFWEKLNRGEFDAGEYRRIGKGGKEIWISASYNPILDMSGKPVKVVKYVSDISKQKLKDAELAALSKTQAVINFTTDGTILDANENFLKAMGYSIDDIRGKHFKVVKYATDITKQKMEWLELVKTLGETASQLSAASEELHRPANQPSRSQCHDRSRSGRRGREGFRRCRQRSEGARQTDSQGHRGYFK